MSENNGSLASAAPERDGGPKAWLVLLGTAVAAAIVVGGVFAYQAWQGDDEATAPTVAPGPDPTEPADELDRGSFLFRRVTDDGIEVRARVNEHGGMFGGVIMEDEAASADTVPATTAAVEGLAAPEVPATTAPAGDVPAATMIAEPIPVDPGIGGPVRPEDIPEECTVVGDLQAWAISSESVAQGGSPWMKVSPDELYPQLLWDGMANEDPEATSIVGVTLQVPDDVTTVRLRSMAGAVDEMEPVQGAVVLALNVPAQAVQDFMNGGMNDPAARNSIQVTAQRADGSVLTASALDAMNKPHPAWSPECQPGIIIDPMPPEPEPEPPALPPAGEQQPADPAAARAEIERHLGLLYGPRDPAIDRSLYIDDNYGMADASEAVERNFPGAAGGSSVTIDDLVFVDATNAVFRYTLDTPAADFPDQIGRARLIDGVWKITRGTLCQDLAHGGGTCPP